MERVTGHIKLVQRKRGPQWYVKYRANGTFRGAKIERLEIFGTRRDALEAVGLREQAPGHQHSKLADPDVPASCADQQRRGSSAGGL
jgi:hypothetical protein